ncbi:hypothetical protein DPEC_G00256010 [Dallia pectoralis]|uniref:Uncharacterized protein n=1 Tax=Dallia pectoralis TaxID=75939 RepID=A0ACC2FUE6_DALPE|nr:hypothetical protein DPEC_G00256010 [Dallia pectoralis]
MSYWPRYASAERCSRAVKREELPGETWGLFDVVIRYTSDTYNEARHKLPLALNFSDLQTEEEDERPAYLKRKGRGTNRQLTTSSESEDEGPFEKQPRTSQVQSKTPKGQLLPPAPVITPPELNLRQSSVVTPQTSCSPVRVQSQDSQRILQQPMCDRKC